MERQLISMFIDDELTIDQKIELVGAIAGDGAYRRELVELLEQEKCLRSEMVGVVPPLVVPGRPRRSGAFVGILKWAASGAAAALAVALVWALLAPPAVSPPPATGTLPYRFVVYQPEATRAEITGSFTRWRKVPMTARGGYWEVTIDLPPGEHRFSYIMDGDRRMADPTVSIRERDDFGGENSILEL